MPLLSAVIAVAILLSLLNGKAPSLLRFYLEMLEIGRFSSVLISFLVVTSVLISFLAHLS